MMNSALSIYIHWPFCKSKCPYCDFNSHVRDRVDHARWRSALLRELAFWARRLPGREIASIFFGGGTPSLMQAQTVASLIAAVREHWKVSQTVEITLESNPTSAEAEQFKAFYKAGVNRVSLGVQALNQEALTFLGRQHDATGALAAVQMAADIFPRMSFDLIYARPQQTLAQWEAELRQALPYAKGHMSLYQLTIEENTAFYHAHKQGKFIMPEEGMAADMYLLTQEIMEAENLPAYEISNHAAPGEESRHNLAYWRSEDTIGIGPGAHGRVRLEGKTFATETLKSPERWLEKVEQAQSAAVETELSEKERMEEMVMMGLRLRGGIRYEPWLARTGVDLHNRLPAAAKERLAQQGLIAFDDEGMEATAQGRLLLNRITAALLATG